MGNPTSLNQHRDPRLLWPLLGSASVVVHGLLLAWLGAVQLNVRPLQNSRPIPIQILSEETAADAVLAAPEPFDLPDPVPDQAFTAAPQVAPEGEQPSPAAETFPLTAPTETAQQLPQAETAPPVPTTPAPQPPPSPQPPPAPAPPAPPSNGSSPSPSNGSGQLIPLGLQVDPAGRDLPDTLPQFQSSSAILIQPLLAGCGQSPLTAVSTTVQLRITVETDGRISQAAVVQGSGDAAVDALAVCLVQQGLQLVPATTAGVERPTDAVILEARLQL
ncbi:MAG: energy transducer TonB [Cyanobacteria bacterium Co-bin13]|nr:energy transducer TonB [Cyanobacteria bacterium Co-bin13]